LPRERSWPHAIGVRDRTRRHGYWSESLFDDLNPGARAIIYLVAEIGLWPSEACSLAHFVRVVGRVQFDGSTLRPMGASRMITSLHALAPPRIWMWRAGWDLAQGPVTEGGQGWQIDRLPRPYDVTTVATAISGWPSDG
jgi:hypothetical protein